ncbi:MAG: glycoside hydrolase family 127 protein [Kiritimatiellales bacterium]|nr:glycoside hydrolase family 127 protein [Kiritimatiellales bacterium]
MEKHIFVPIAAAVVMIGLLTTMNVQAAGNQLVMKSDAGDGCGKPALSMLPAGDIKPQGWIRKQMDLDLREGLAGKYGKVSNMVNNRIFVNKNGTLADPYTYPGGSASRSWWVGEVEGNLLDANVRLAFLTDNAEYKTKVEQQIGDILDAQKNEPDGYIGIYVPSDRFALRTEKFNNGELWTQAHLFQAMLAYYEYTKDARVLEAVEKAVDCTLNHYEGKEVFQQGSGVSHGIAFTDTLEWLYRLTDDPKYVKAMRWLYDDFSQKETESVKKANADLSYDELKHPDRLWWSHTPHTMEGIQTPIITYRMTHAENYRLAAENVLMKYDRHDTPGGGVVGDEGIDRRLGTSMLPREYCTMVSAVMALNRIAAWTGNLDAARRAETIVLNAAQGARLQPVATAVRYLSHDNQKDASEYTHGGRYLYAPMHAAPCCATVAPRLMPYYVEGMWFADQNKNELIASYYGPNRVDATVAGRRISIIEETDYPFSDKIRFVFDSDANTTLVLRRPPRSGDVKIDAEGATVDAEGGTISIHGTWKKGDVVSVDFDFKPQLIVETNLTNSSYYCWGPLLFSLPLGEDREAGKEYEAQEGDPSGCFMLEIRPVHPERWDYRFDPKETFAQADLPGGNGDTPYANPPVGLEGKMLDGGGSKVAVMLTPLGSSLLRRTAFPDCSKPVVDPQTEWIVRKKIVNPDGTMTEEGAKKTKHP